MRFRSPLGSEPSTCFQTRITAGPVSHTYRRTQLGGFPHLETITPRSDLVVRSWLPVDVLEDLIDDPHLDPLLMFLRRISSRTR